MKIKTHYIFVAIAILIIGALAMSYTKIEVRTDADKTSLPSIDDVPQEDWVKLAEKKIFFGHKSVGYNIIDGIEDILNEYEQIKLNMVGTCDPAEFDLPIFAHSQVGRNTDPVSKIESFTNIMDAGVGNKVDIAFFKFCYVDVTRDSEPQKILDRYSAAIDDLRERYPKTRFIHVSVPICSAPKGMKRKLKESIKLLIGRQGLLEDNKMRQSYSTLLRDMYSQTEPVFDLGLIESIGPGNKGCYVSKGAVKVPVMASEYTDDGGHLNELGRRKVAEQLLIMLAKMAGKPE